jgi:hypothetical protein
MASIQQSWDEVDRRVREVRRTVERATSAEEAEGAAWAGLLALGQLLMGAYFDQRASAWMTGKRYSHADRRYEIVGAEGVEIGTRFGKVAVARPVGRLVGAPRASRDLPFDREVGLAGGFTLPVVTLVARLTALMAFAASRELMKSLLAWAPSSRSVLRIVDAVGAQARPFLEQAPPPDEDGEVLVITVDGKGAPAISSREYARRAVPHGTRDVNRRHARRKKRQEHPRKRRGPGKKSKNAKMAAVGVLYTLRRAADGRLEGPANKRTYATFVSHRALFEWIHAEARRRGYGTKKFKKVLFIADGAEVLWSLQQEFFPDADVCLDWFHVVEKLWKAGKAICRGTRRERQHLEAWVAEQKRSLRHGKHAEVAAVIEAALEATPVTGPGNKYRREVLAEVAAHLRKNAARLEYSRLRRQDLDISSGIIEGAVRHLVGVRLDGPGMRWSRDRAEAVLQLRCVLINGLWGDFEQFLGARRVRLAAQPVPTRTHDAVLKKAA